jgi:hypothetical protein
MAVPFTSRQNSDTRAAVDLAAMNFGKTPGHCRFLFGLGSRQSGALTAPTP